MKMCLELFGSLTIVGLAVGGGALRAPQPAPGALSSEAPQQPSTLAERWNGGGKSLAAGFSTSQQTTEQGSAYAPLWLYQGTWEMRKANAATGAPPERLTDQCAVIAHYFACQQTVNGKIGSLIIFIPTEKAGHYYTQAVLPEGWAAGRGELDIDGDRWTYSSQPVQEHGKTTYYRTTNVFTGRDKIHFEQLESSDGEHWTVKDSGDETRVAIR